MVTKGIDLKHDGARGKRMERTYVFLPRRRCRILSLALPTLSAADCVLDLVEPGTHSLQIISSGAGEHLAIMFGQWVTGSDRHV